MKILMLTPYLPFPLLSGGQIRSYHLIKQMAQKHEITLFALIKDESEREFIPELEKYCQEVRVFKRSAKPFTPRNLFTAIISSFTANNYPFVVIRNYSAEAFTAVDEELKNNKYDLIHAETFYMMPHIPQTKVPKILVEQTIEYLGYESFAKNFNHLKRFFLTPFLNLDIAKIKKWERFYWKTCDLLVTMSEDDKKFIADDINTGRHIEVVANGVDTEVFKEKKKSNHIPQPTILFVGTFKWLPNVEAAKFLVDQVWPLVRDILPTAKLWIVGNAPTPEVYAFAQQDNRIEVTGGIPDIRDAYNNSHILCAPVFSGKGTRYKIIEAMATGTPIVATTTAVEGLNIKNGEQALIADTAEDLAKAVIRLLQDDNLQKKLAKHGQTFVEKNYDWNLIGLKLDELYQKIGQSKIEK